LEASLLRSLLAAKNRVMQAISHNEETEHTRMRRRLLRTDFKNQFSDRRWGPRIQIIFPLDQKQMTQSYKIMKMHKLFV